MELLAPAGDRDSLLAALKGGADAVYLGAKELNARRTAGNFDFEALIEAADLCHEKGARLYVTVNTMLKQAELRVAQRVAGELARAGVDGAIVQDLGAAAALREMLPSLALHASTQMAVHNLSGVRYAQSLGFARCVLAREMTFDEIAACAQAGIELEVFAHGALCVACSGQCLFSSLVGGRSGNRGLCAQPCRLPYKLEGPRLSASGDLLSPKDLMTLPMLHRLKASGAASLKLEGRLKGPEYVYAVTSAYRRALDGEEVDPAQLREVFNRGYTAGYGPFVDDSELMSDPAVQHVLPGRHEWEAPRERLIPLTGRLTVRVGEALSLTLSDGTDEAAATGPLVERAQKLPVDFALRTRQIEKMGGTPYRLASLGVDADTDAFASAAALNALRRDALLTLGRLRVERRRGCARDIMPLPSVDLPKQRACTPLLCVESSDASMLERALSWGADEIVWSPLDVTGAGLERAPVEKFTLALPPVLSELDLERVNQWALGDAMKGAIQGVIASNAGHLSLRWPGAVRAGFMMNVANAWTVKALNMPYAPSIELTAAEIRALPGEKELPVYGRIALMQLRHCPLNACLKGGRHADCRRCDGERGIDQYALTDRMGARFALERMRTGTGCVVRVLNSVPLMLLRHLDALPPAARWRVILTDETKREAECAVKCHRAALDESDFKLLPEWTALDGRPSTTGHYFRGVM